MNQETGSSSARTAKPPAQLLSALRLLDALRERAWRARSAIPLAQLLRAQSLLVALHKQGVAMSGPHLARLLTALLATSRESQERIGAALGEMATGGAAPERTITPGTRKLLLAARWRWLAIAAVALLVVAAAILAWTLLVGGAVQRGQLIRGQVLVRVTRETLERDLALYFIGQYLVPALYILVPAVGIIIWLLRPRRDPRAALRRITGTGRVFERLNLPPVETGILRGASVRRAMADLRRPALVGGDRLDVRATIRATVGNGGAPALRWRREARAREYVLLCERSSAADHMTLVADALAARLAGANVAFTRYDLGIGFEAVRHAGGRRSGPPSDSIDAVRRRHGGARLILLGHSESLSRRYEAHGGRAALVDLVEAFDSPLLLSVNPPTRWGWREAKLREAGLALFPADEDGIAGAVPWLAAMEADAVSSPPRIDGGEDPLVAQLHRDALRLASNTAPSDSEVALLVRRLRAYFADTGGLDLLAAIAAFPRIDPAITARLALLADGRPIDARLACRLASLPWLRAGRMPDWLILALLRSLPEARREAVRGTLLLLLDDLRAAQGGERTDPLARAARLEILTRSGVAGALLARLKLGAPMVTGESIFLRFLEGRPLDELDQPDMARVRRPSTWRIVAAGTALAMALIGVAGAPSLLAAMRGAVERPGSGWVVYLLFAYVMPLWNVQSLILGTTGRRGRVLAGAAHLLLYLALPFVLAEGATYTDAILMGLPALFLAAIHIGAFAMLPERAEAAFPLVAIRIGITAVSILVTVILLAKYYGGALDAVLVVVLIAIFSVQRALRRQSRNASTIIAAFPWQVVLTLLSAMTAVIIAAFIVVIFGTFSNILNTLSGNLIGRAALLAAMTYLFLAMRFDRRFLFPASTALFALVALGWFTLSAGDPSISASAGFSYGTGLIGVGSVFLVRRGAPRKRLAGLLKGLPFSLASRRAAGRKRYAA